jgi:hypothetical protein
VEKEFDWRKFPTEVNCCWINGSAALMRQNCTQKGMGRFACNSIKFDVRT